MLDLPPPAYGELSNHNPFVLDVAGHVHVHVASGGISAFESHCGPFRQGRWFVGDITPRSRPIRRDPTRAP